MDIPAASAPKVKADSNLGTGMNAIPTRRTMPLWSEYWLRLDPVAVGCPNREVARTGHSQHNLDVATRTQGE
jgi:hypothetical protein